ncbi:MAG: response regulator [Ginsengibacter sp.]
MKRKLKSILLIDDDEPTNFFSSLLIEDADCTEHIQIADSGQRALGLLKSDVLPIPDLIFLDINMPAMDGWEFLEKYRQLPIDHQSKIVIIMLTTSLNPDDREKASKIKEISGFETKPLTSELIDKVLLKYFQSAVKV